MPRPLALLLVVQLIVASSRVAHAAPPGVSLSVTRAPGAADCPDEATLRASIDHILGRPASVAKDGAITAEVAFDRQDAAYVASLRVRGEKEGERSLRDPGPGCAALAEGVAVTLALLLEPRDDAASKLGRPPPPAEPGRPPPPAKPGRPPPPAEPGRPPPPAEPGRPPPPAEPGRPPPPAEPGRPPPPTEPERIDEPPPDEKTPTSGWVAISAGPAVGLVGAPSLALGPEVGLELLRHWSFRLGGAGVLPRSSPAGDGNVSVSLLAAHASICGAVATFQAAIRPALCARAAGGVLRGEGMGYQTTDSRHLSWFAGGVGAELGGRVSGFVWGVEATLLVPTRRQSFSAEPSGIAYDSSAVAAVFSVRAGAILW